MKKVETMQSDMTTELNTKQYTLGIDVGSTTVKIVLVDDHEDKIIWRDYQRHETKQPEKVLEFLKQIETEIGRASCRERV